MPLKLFLSLKQKQIFPAQSENREKDCFFSFCGFFLSLMRRYCIFYPSCCLNRSCTTSFTHKLAFIPGTLYKECVHINMLLPASGSDSFSTGVNSLHFTLWTTRKPQAEIRLKNKKRECPAWFWNISSNDFPSAIRAWEDSGSVHILYGP